MYACMSINIGLVNVGGLHCEAFIESGVIEVWYGLYIQQSIFESGSLMCLPDDP